jgi:hypothetical protein
VKHNPDIAEVLVYNDNGGFEFQQMGKYQGRLYIFGPDAKISKATGYYAELNAPRPPLGTYNEYLDSCKILYKKIDQKMAATVYDCRAAMRNY